VYVSSALLTLRTRMAIRADVNATLLTGLRRSSFSFLPVSASLGPFLGFGLQYDDFHSVIITIIMKTNLNPSAKLIKLFVSPPQNEWSPSRSAMPRCDHSFSKLNHSLGGPPCGSQRIGNNFVQSGKCRQMCQQKPAKLPFAGKNAITIT